MSVHLKVRNRLPLTAVNLRLVGGPAGYRPTGLPAARRGSSRVAVDVVPDRRGIFRLADCRIETSFPFGIMRAGRAVKSDDQITVWPALAEVDRRLVAEHCHRELGTNGHAGAVAEQEFADIRAYRRGDSVRAIHWQQTARHERLIVRERAAGARRRVMLTLDVRASSYPSPAAFEAAVSAAAALSRHAVDNGVALTLRWAGSRLSATEARDLDHVMDALALVEVNQKRSDATALRGSGLFVTTNQGAATAGGAFVPVRVDGEVAA